MTHRQHVVTEAWLALQWEIPDRHDWYLMQAAAEVRRGHVKNPNKVKVNDLKLAFEQGKGKAVKTGKGVVKSKEEADKINRMLAAKRAKAERKAQLGGSEKVKTLQITKEEAALLRSLPPGEASALRRQWVRERLGETGV